jgi:hypothetical protein
VNRPNHRFEVRESLHTPKGSRSHSLANFAVLTDEVLQTAAGRASRGFDREAVKAAARRLGAPIGTADDRYRRFVESSRAFGRALERPPAGFRRDAGASLIELLGFVDAVSRTQAARPTEPLEFPNLARLASSRRHSG